MMMRSRMIEKLGDGVADLVESGPVQVAKYDPLLGFLFRGFDEAHLRCEISPRLAVEDQSVDPRPKLRVHRFGKIILPPKIKRQIGIEVGENNARQQFYTRPFQQ